MGCGPRLRRLFAGNSPRRPGFDLGSVYVRYLTKSRGVAPRTSAFPCQRHCAIAPNLSLPTCYFIQKGNRAEHGNLNKELLFRKLENFVLHKSTFTVISVFKMFMQVRISASCSCDWRAVLVRGPLGTSNPRLLPPPLTIYTT